MSNVRTELGNLGDEKRYSFKGTYNRSGEKNKHYEDAYANKYYDQTLLLNDIYAMIDGKEYYLTDHLWLNYTKQFKRYGVLQKGDVIMFDGRVSTYSAQYGMNYKIERPSKVKIFRDNQLLEHDDYFFKMSYLEFQEYIHDENADYYDKRDSIQSYYRIPHYYTTIKTWPDIKGNIIVSGKRYSEEEFKKEFKTADDIIKLYELYIEDKIILSSYYESSGQEILESEIERNYTEKQLINNRERDDDSYFDDDDYFNDADFDENYY